MYAKARIYPYTIDHLRFDFTFLGLQCNTDNARMMVLLPIKISVFFLYCFLHKKMRVPYLNQLPLWQILNRCINKSKQASCFPKCFKANNVEVTENKDIADGFNNFLLMSGQT